MANVNHSTLTDPYLHEPKGIGSAGTGTVYVADGAGSGTWLEKTRFIGAYIPFDSATPAYQHSCTTSDTILDPSFSVADSNGFSGEAVPNARVKYTGTETIDVQIIFTISAKQVSGGDKDIEWSLWKNGVELGGSRVVRTTPSGSWGSSSVYSFTELVTNDYLEVKVKAEANCTIDVASAFMSIMGSAH